MNKRWAKDTSRLEGEKVINLIRRELLGRIGSPQLYEPSENIYCDDASQNENNVLDDETPTRRLVKDDIDNCGCIKLSLGQSMLVQAHARSLMQVLPAIETVVGKA